MKNLTVAFTLGALAFPAAFAASATEHDPAAHPAAAAEAVNRLGCELLTRGMPSHANALLSPYSIQTALAMTYAGAAGATHAEMAEVLHYPVDQAQLHQSFAALRKTLEALAARTAERAARAQQRGDAMDSVHLAVANRLFGQDGFEFRPSFLSLVADTYQAPFQSMDFERHPAAATEAINAWVEEKTRERIRQLIPPGALDTDTRLVLVNAIYLKAPWANAFSASATKPRPFRIAEGSSPEVPTMLRQDRFGYQRLEGFTAVTIPYIDGELQFLVLLPDAHDGLADLESRLSPELLAQCANPPRTELILHLPKLKLEPPLFKLGETLQALGLTSAFDQPRGSANFDCMAPRKPDDYLHLSEVFHQTFLDLDENGTEAAAATAVAMVRATSLPAEKPIEVRVDRPFLFAIQHRPSATCLFLGRIVDPR